MDSVTSDMTDPVYRTIIEPFRIHSVQPIRMTTKQDRITRLVTAELQPVQPSTPTMS